MKCTSCQVEIDPKWSHAIETNVCPYCGKSIMEEHLKNLLVSLKETMEKLKDYPQQLNDWLLSNYEFVHINSPKLAELSPKRSAKEVSLPKQDNKFNVTIKTDEGEQEVVAEKIQTEEKTSEFFRRAEAVKPNIDGFSSASEKTNHLKNIVQQIKKNGIKTEPDDQLTVELEEELDSGNDQLISSSLLNNEDDDIPPSVLAMASSAKGGSGTNYADLQKLQQLQNKTEMSRRNFESGANRGKGGFSRSG